MLRAWYGLPVKPTLRAHLAVLPLPLRANMAAEQHCGAAAMPGLVLRCRQTPQLPTEFAAADRFERLVLVRSGLRHWWAVCEIIPLLQSVVAGSLRDVDNLERLVV